jgi:hypothetical protein
MLKVAGFQILNFDYCWPGLNEMFVPALLWGWVNAADMPAREIDSRRPWYWFTPRALVGGLPTAAEPTSSTVLTTFQLRRLAYRRIAFTCKGGSEHLPRYRLQKRPRTCLD